MLDVSDVDKVCVCRSGQFALKRAFIDGSPHQMQSALQGHFGFAEGLANGHIRSGLHTYNLQVTFTCNCVDWAKASSWREIGMARKGNRKGIVKENCGDVYIFDVGPYSYWKTRRVVGIAIEI